MAGKTRKVQKPGGRLSLQWALCVLRQGLTLESGLAFNLPFFCLNFLRAGVTNVCYCAWLPLYFSACTHWGTAFLTEGYCVLLEAWGGGLLGVMPG